MNGRQLKRQVKEGVYAAAAILFMVGCAVVCGLFVAVSATGNAP